MITKFNKYKFIICLENSYDDSYITEKIFNCFFSRTIPIYKGSPIIKNYINENSMIDLNMNDIINKINLLNNNEILYNKIINSEKINYLYSCENYQERMINFIRKKLNIM